jgi:hypothetical protein
VSVESSPMTICLCFVCCVRWLCCFFTCMCLICGILLYVHCEYVTCLHIHSKNLIACNSFFLAILLQFKYAIFVLNAVFIRRRVARM